MDIKLWSKRVAFVTAAVTLFGLLFHTWNQLGLPIPALAADVKNLDKAAAQPDVGTHGRPLQPLQRYAGPKTVQNVER